MTTPTKWAFRTMIVPSDYQQLAQQLAATLGGVSGKDMFTVPLSASGIDPATHYVSTGGIGARFADLLPLDTYTTETDLATGNTSVTRTHTDGNPDAVALMAQQEGLEVTAQQVADLFAACDITEQEPFTAFARLNLKIVQQPLTAQ